MEESKPSKKEIEDKIDILSRILNSYHEKKNGDDILLAFSHLIKPPLCDIVFPEDGLALAEKLTDIKKPNYFSRDLEEIIKELKIYVKDL